MEFLSNNYLIISIFSLSMLLLVNFTSGDVDLGVYDLSAVGVFYSLSFSCFILFMVEPFVSNIFILVLIGLISFLIGIKTKKYIFKKIYNNSSNSIGDLAKIINKTGIVTIANKHINQYEIYVDEVKNSFIVKSYDKLEKGDNVILLDIEDGIIIVTKVK